MDEFDRQRIIKKTWNNLKDKGFFERFKNYEEWHNKPRNQKEWEVKKPEPDEFSIEGLEKSAKEGNEEAEKRKENPEGLIKEYEQGRDEIDINSLPL